MFLLNGILFHLGLDYNKLLWLDVALPQEHRIFDVLGGLLAGNRAMHNIFNGMMQLLGRPFLYRILTR